MRISKPPVVFIIFVSLFFMAAAQVTYALVRSPYAEAASIAATTPDTELLVFEINREVVKSDRGFPKDHPPKDSANGDWTKPINFAEGTMYYRAQIRSMPKSQEMQLQFCVWQDSFNLENCAQRARMQGDPGTVVTWSQPVKEMWRKDGHFIDWSRPRQRYAMVVRNKKGDPVSNNLGWNWYGENPDNWYPMDIRFTVVVVAKGATFSGWQNYGGSGGGGGEPTLTPTPTSTPFTPHPDGKTIYLSSSSNGRVEDVKFKDEDILGHDPVGGHWWMVFDGSDVGITGDVNGFTFLDDGSLLFTLNTSANLPGVGKVDDSDIVQFIPATFGNTTAGSFQLYFDGSDVALSTGGEDLDALSMLADGSLLLSTMGSISANGLSAKDEDLVRFAPTSVGETTQGALTLFVDGSALELTKGSEDVWAAHYDESADDLYLSTSANFAALGATGGGDDIFVCRHPRRADATCQLFWAGAASGFANESIDGLFIGAGPEVTVSAASDMEDDLLFDLSEFAEDNVMEDENGEELEVISTIYVPMLMR